MKAQAKTKLKQLKTGVHLVAITDAVQIKDHDNMPLIDKVTGESGITIRFSDGDNNHFDQDYWFNGDRQHFFDKMAATANIDPSNRQFKAEAKGKRLWICIKEVHEIDHDQPVTDINGPVINYYLFDTMPALHPFKKPLVKGDPADNDGVASGAFLDYKQTNGNVSITINNGMITGMTITNHERLEQAAKQDLIKEIESHLAPKSDPWDNDSEATGSPQKSAQEEIDWDNF